MNIGANYEIVICQENRCHGRAPGTYLLRRSMRILPLLLISGAVSWCQNTGGRNARPATPTPVSGLLNVLMQSVNPDQAMKDVRTIWDTDRWFTFPKFEETARNVAGILRRAGLEDVEIGNAPADGVTQAGFWTEPLAWDVHVGTLEIVEQ